MIQPFFKNIMIDREDMLALTRRMNVKRTSITRIAGAYIDREGFVDGTFNTRFLKLSAPERARNLEIAKAIPFAETNLSLKRYVIPQEKRGEGTLWQLLMGARSAGLENDALLDIFYEVAAARYRPGHDYGVFFFHDRYDIPAKAADHERLGESEQVFEYLICGFLFPAYAGGGALVNCIDIYQADKMFGILF